MQSNKRQMLPARHELKYFVNPAELTLLRAKLRPVLAMDSHCRGGRPYAIRSLYFDDAYDTAWRDKVDGVQNRDKYRIRIYNHSDSVIFLERKRKMGDLIQKSSVRITRRLAEQLMAGDPQGLDRVAVPLLNDMYVEMRTKLLRPTVMVDYWREAYVHPAETTRITCDTHLRTGLFDRNLFVPNAAPLCPHDRNVEVREVKFDRVLPPPVAALLTGIAAERSAISKYVLCRRFEPLV